MKHDLLLAFRSLGKTPFLTFAVVISLALGIGANTAIFSLVDQMLLRALPVQHAGKLVFLDAPGARSGSRSNNGSGGQDAIFSYPMMRDLIAKQDALAELAAYRTFGANLAFRGTTLAGTLEGVTGNYFTTLGVTPLLGRMLSPADDAGSEQVVVLSYAYWADRLGRDSKVLNEKIVVNGHPMTIVGVAPRGFHGTTMGNLPDVFAPIALKPMITPGVDERENRRNWWVYMVGRLKDGGSLEQAQAKLAVTYKALMAEETKQFTGVGPDFLKEYVKGTIILKPGSEGRSDFQDEAKTPLTALLIITLFVLLIACANVANLQLVRAANRARDIAVRVALGAGRWPVFRQMLTESLVLGIAGAGVGLLIGQAALRLLIAVAVPPGAPAGFLSAELDPRVLVFTLVLGVVTGIIFGTYPSFTASRIAVADTLKDQSGQVLSSGAARIRKGLVMAQMALSLTLLISAGLFAQSLANVSRVSMGFQPENLIVFGVAPDLNGYKTPEIRSFAERASAELKSLPGITGVGISEVPFLDDSSWGANITVEGYTPPDDDPNPLYANIGPGLMETLGVKLVAGREFSRADGTGAPKVVIVNERFVKKYFGSNNPLGRRMAIGGGRTVKPDMEIVGVVKDMKYAEVKDEVPPLFYRPLAQTDAMSSFYFYVRATLPAETAVSQVRQTMARIDPNLPLEPMRTVTEQLEINTHTDRVIVKLAVCFAALATLLALVGLYGVMAYNVASRTREIGIRMAFGAAAWPIQGMVLREAVGVLAIGAAFGLASAFWLTRYAESLLYGVTANDVVVYASATAVVGVAGLIAAFLPARRAASVDPMTCLRYE